MKLQQLIIFTILLLYNVTLSFITSIKKPYNSKLMSKLLMNTNSNDNINKKLSIMASVLFFASSEMTIPMLADAYDSSDVPSFMVADEVTNNNNQISNVVKLPSGVQYFDVKIGDISGPTAEEGRSVQFLWVLRRSNGYYVDGSSNYNNEPFIYKVGNTKKVIKGVDEAIRGMRVNGIRRINIPPELAFVEGVGDDKPGPMPEGFGPRRQILTRIDKETWYFEIKIVKIK